MVFQMAGRTDDNQMGGMTSAIKTNFYQNMNAIFKQLLSEGKITEVHILMDLLLFQFHLINQ